MELKDLSSASPFWPVLTLRPPDSSAPLLQPCRPCSVQIHAPTLTPDYPYVAGCYITSCLTRARPDSFLYVQFCVVLPLTSSHTTLWPSAPETVSTTVLYFLFGGRGKPTPYSAAGFGMFRLNWMVVSFGMFLKSFRRPSSCKHITIWF